MNTGGDGLTCYLVCHLFVIYSINKMQCHFFKYLKQKKMHIERVYASLNFYSALKRCTFDQICIFSENNKINKMHIEAVYASF